MAILRKFNQALQNIDVFDSKNNDDEVFMDEDSNKSKQEQGEKSTSSPKNLQTMKVANSKNSRKISKDSKSG